MISYDNLQNIFLSGKRPYWWLYLGKTKNSGTPIGSNTDEADVETSLALLSELLDNYGDGTYTLEVRSSLNSAKNNPVHTFFVGEPSRNGAAIGAVAPREESSFTKGVDMRYWMDKVDRLTEQCRSLELSNLSLKNDLALERMKRKEVEQAEPDTLGRILGVVERNPALLNHVSGLFAGGQAPAAIGVLKSTKPIPTEELRTILQNGPTDPTFGDDEEDYDDDDDDTDNVSGNFSIDRAVSACYRISTALPGHDINNLLEKIAQTAESNPDKIKMALNFL